MKPYYLPLLFLLCLCLFESGCSNTVEESEEKPNEKAASVKVSLATVESYPSSEAITIPGTVTALPDHSLKISPAIAGKLQHVYVVAGQRVCKGQLLAKLNDQHILDQLEQNRATVEAANTNLSQAQNNLTFAKDNVVRQKRLFDAEVSAKKDIVTAQNQELNAQAQVATAVSQIHSAQAARKQIETESKFTTIKSPMNGIVANRFLNSGDTADPTTAIVQIVDLGTVLINAQLPADSPFKVKPGEKATIQTISDAQLALPGVVTAVSPIVDTAANTIRVQIQCPNKADLKEGQSVNVSINQKFNKTALLVPRAALVPNPEKVGEVMVYVVDAGTAHRVPVIKAEVLGDKVEIVNGLKIGQQIIAHNAYGLPDGCHVVAETNHE